MTKKTWRDKGPSVRPVKGGVVVDSLDQFAGQITGMPPENFNELLELARKVPEQLKNLLGFPATEPADDELARLVERARDVLLLGAHLCCQSASGNFQQNALAFVQRAKQVAQWCKRPIEEMTPLSILEHKGRELARLVAERLFTGEGFVLLIFNEGKGGHTHWISSAPRNDTLKMLAELVEKIGEDQGNLS